MLKASLQLKLSQQLTMTPQLQQAIRLLQLPIMELQTQIREALETNVMLEAVEETASNEIQQDDSEPRAEAEVSESRENSGQSEDGWEDTRAAAVPEGPWPGPESRPSQDFADRRNETLQEYLLWQLGLERLSASDMAIGRALIDAINDDGYLIDTLEEICDVLKPELDVSQDEAERVLWRVQRLDPPGVGARTVSECVVLQLDQLDPQTPALELTLRLASDHLDLVAAQQFAALRRRLQISDEDLEAALALVRSCHPRPGSVIDAGEPEYVVPDVFVRKVDGRWNVEVNGAASPRLRVNQTYANVLRRSSDHAMLRTQLQEARWLIRSLEIRNETLLKVARCIVDKQQAFLERGDEAMQPMVLRDVAEAIEMHESTISRVTTNKYMHTPRGVFELRYFFSSHVGSFDGGEHSSTAVRAKIRKLISQEDPTKPLSDNKIADALSKDGVRVARRTIAKYREAMSIPPSNERKHLAVRS